jgi:hypothetical protein
MIKFIDIVDKVFESGDMRRVEGEDVLERSEGYTDIACFGVDDERTLEEMFTVRRDRSI